MPTDRHIWPNDHQAGAPIAPPRQQGQARPRRGIDTPGFNAALLEERKLATKHQVLGFEGSPGPDREDGQTDRIGKQPQNNPGEGNHASSCHGQRWTRQSETHRPKAASPILLLWPTGDDAASGLAMTRGTAMKSGRKTPLGRSMLLISVFPARRPELAALCRRQRVGALICCGPQQRGQQQTSATAHHKCDENPPRCNHGAILL